MKRRLAAAGVAIVVVGIASAASIASQRAWERAGRERWAPRGAFLPRERGRALRVWCEGSGPIVVLEATGLGTAEQYGQVIERLKDHARACAYDRAGYGYSDGRAAPARLDDLRDDLWAVAEYAGSGPYVWVAGSFGGLPALYTARSHVGATRGLVLLDAVVPGVLARLESAGQRLDRSASQAELLASLGLLRWLDPLELDGSQAAWLTYRPVVWSSFRDLLATRQGALAALERLPPLPPDLPLQIVRHEKLGEMMGPDVTLAEYRALEPSWQAAQAEMAASSTRGALVVARGTGHYIAAERPELVAELVDLVLGTASSQR